MDVATACPDIHQHDLVSFGPGLLDCGVVEAKGAAVEEDGTSPPVPTFHILCLDNSTVTKKASDLTVIDRSYLNIAQVVASASNVGGQIGAITGTTTLLDLVKLDERGEVVETVSGVSPSRVRRVRPLGHGDLVVSGPWLGQVSDVSVDVDVSFDDGAICTVADAEGNEMLQTVTEYHYEKYLPQKNSRFFPGQRAGSAGSVFKDARWLRGHWNADRDVGTVVKVEMSSVLVHWIASTHCGTDQRLVEESAPPAYQNPRDLTFYCVAYNNFGWGPADRCFFTEPGSTHGDSSFAHDPQLEEEEQQHGACLDKVELPMTVAKTRTYVDVLWQDGTRQHGVPSESVVPFNNINDQEFLPGYHVVDNASLDGATIIDDTASDGSTKPARRVGVVRTVCCKNQTVNVSWFKAAACPNGAREVESNDIVSAYDLELHPGDTTDLGDTVVRLLPSGSSDGETSIQSQSKSKTEKNVAPTNLSWVGCVIDLPDGHVQVKWGDGSISTVLPHEIVVAYEEDYMELKDKTDEDSDTDSVSTDNDPMNPAEDGDAESGSDESNEDGLLQSATFKGWFSSFVWSLIRLACEVLSQGKGFLTMWPLSWFPSSELPAPTKENIRAPTNASGGEKNATDATTDDQSFRFSHFDVLQVPPDHHYIDTADEVSRGKSWPKTVQKEWKILENNLPETIYVRGFEDRMDLLRAVMIGASGTPYEDGLFFFDLQLPPSYPAVPPQVYYHSFGLCLNPNLYESGHVCLSLLNTWGGEGTEVWLPAESSLLQVLVSIQGLVLNDQPYYNEAGYETLVGTPKGRRNALPYGENAYLLTLRSMLHVLRRPPQKFEAFVKDHFRRRGRFVLRTCEAYHQGCVNANILGDANATMLGRERSCSVGLKLALANVIPRLVAAFIEIGVEGCEEFQKMRVSLPQSLSTTQ